MAEKEKKEVKKGIARQRKLLALIYDLIKEDQQKNKKGYSYLTNREIAEKVGSNEYTVSRNITFLAQGGYLSREMDYAPVFCRKLKIKKELF